MLRKSLIQFFVDGWGCVFSLLFDLRPNYGGGNEDNGNLLQKGLILALLHSVPPTLQQATTDPRFCLETPVKSVTVSCGVTAPFSWVLVYKILLCPPRVYFPVWCKFCNQIPLASKVKFPGGSQSLCQIPRLGNLLWVLELS